jgi:hypothetical protein
VDGWRQPLGYSCARVTELFAVMAAAICPDAKIKGPCYGSTGPIERDRPDRPSANLADPSAETEITKFLRWSQPELMLFIAQSLKGCSSPSPRSNRRPAIERCGHFGKSARNGANQRQPRCSTATRRLACGAAWLCSSAPSPARP